MHSIWDCTKCENTTSEFHSIFYLTCNILSNRLTRDLAHLEKRAVFPLMIGHFLQTFLVLNLIMQNGTEKGAVHSTGSLFQGKCKNTAHLPMRRG
jgi:hypothetical protein